MEKPTLVILAAGMGSRYGGLKQIDPVDDKGHKIIDFSIYDAVRAGFGKVVFIIKREHEQDFRECIGNAVSKHIPVEYVFQELTKVPEGFQIPEGRVKPWGTAHAILCCKGVVNEPFAVINADDFYGKEGFEALAEELVRMNGKKNEYCMVGYRVGNTLSDSGTVARGVCVKNRNGYLTEVVERTKVMRVDGIPCYKDDNDEWVMLEENTPVSMNMWGFTPDYFEHSEKMFVDFLKESGNELKSEFFIPTVVSRLIEDGISKVKVLDTDAKWFGVTYASDKQGVMDKIKELVDAGVYPQKLDFKN